MGLFDKSAEQLAKEDERQKTVKDRNREAQDAELQKHGMLLEDYDVDTLRSKNSESLRIIAHESGFANSVGRAIGISVGDPADKVEINLLKMLTQQNFIVIRQNEQIIRLLEKSADGESATAPHRDLRTLG